MQAADFDTGCPNYDRVIFTSTETNGRRWSDTKIGGLFRMPGAELKCLAVGRLHPCDRRVRATGFVSITVNHTRLITNSALFSLPMSFH